MRCSFISRLRKCNFTPHPPHGSFSKNCNLGVGVFILGLINVYCRECRLDSSPIFAADVLCGKKSRLNLSPRGWRVFIRCWTLCEPARTKCNSKHQFAYVWNGPGSGLRVSPLARDSGAEPSPCLLIAKSQCSSLHPSDGLRGNSSSRRTRPMRRPRPAVPNGL